MLSAASLMLGGGCQSHPKPFADVTERERHTPTQAEAIAEAPSAPMPAAHEANTIETMPTPAVATIEPAPAPAAATAPAPLKSQELPPAEYHLTPAPAGSAIPWTIGVRGDMHRNWPPSVAYRPSGDVASGPVYWSTVDKLKHRPDWVNLPMEPIEFALSTILLPFRAIITPPWKEIIYSPVGPPGGGQIDQPGGAPQVPTSGQ